MRRPGSTKVGIAGRTGCGKSTLVATLFRLVEPCGGRVLIDGVDTARIGLQDLRSRLALVPQVGCCPFAGCPNAATRGVSQWLAVSATELSKSAASASPVLHAHTAVHSFPARDRVAAQPHRRLRHSVHYPSLRGAANCFGRLCFSAPTQSLAAAVVIVSA